MTSLTKKLSILVGKAFIKEGLPAELGAVRVSDRPDLAQFQCNGAMAAAKQARKPPREIAETITETLKTLPEIAKADIAGPGFINIHLTDEYLASHLTEISQDKRCGIEKGVKEETVIVDYGGMNVAKAMHVGHLRPTIIGDCIKKIMHFAGYKTLGDIHMGDWGLQMGQIISEFELRSPDWPYFDPELEGPYPETPPFSYEDLERIYPEASAACKEDPKRLELARKATAELQEGRPGYRALWQHFMTLSIADIKANLGPLNVGFEIWKGESDVNDLVPEITEDLESRKISEKSDGAWIVRVDKPEDKKEMPPLIFLKSDGAMTYGTSDLATIYDRTKTYQDLGKIIYVVDKRQSLHFEQVFRAAEQAGYVDSIELHHVGNGTVNGSDGKPFKTRDGGVMKFSDMISAAIEKAQMRLDEAELAQDIDETERQNIAEKVAVAALKFTELSNQPHVDYIFDLDRMISFEGKTGPYLLYQAVRIKSLLRKAEININDTLIETPEDLAIGDAERPLLLLLTELPDHFTGTLKNYSPLILCDYAFKLAQEFSSFYGTHHILSEQNEKLRNSRLFLCQQTYRQLELILNLLGINVPNRM